MICERLILFMRSVMCVYILHTHITWKVFVGFTVFDETVASVLFSKIVAWHVLLLFALLIYLMSNKY